VQQILGRGSSAILEQQERVAAVRATLAVMLRKDQGRARPRTNRFVE
jgi:hypothetical protein